MMISKRVAEKLISAVFEDDKKHASRLDYPTSSSYCREMIVGYREEPDVIKMLDLDITRNTLDCMLRSHCGEYWILRHKYRDGEQQFRNPLNAALRLFRRKFEFHSDNHAGILQAI